MVLPANFWRNLLIAGVVIVAILAGMAIFFPAFRTWLGIVLLGGAIGGAALSNTKLAEKKAEKGADEVEKAAKSIELRDEDEFAHRAAADAARKTAVEEAKSEAPDWDKNESVRIPKLPK